MLNTSNAALLRLLTTHGGYRMTSSSTPINPDPLGYAVYAETLWQRIRDALNRDGPKDELGDDPLVIGIFGEWGAGKSYLLEKMYQQAKKHQRDLSLLRHSDGGFHLTIPVSFQPWKYEHEEHLHVPLLLHILAALEDGLKEARTFWERAADASQKPGNAIIRALPKVVGLFKKVVVGAGVALNPAAGAALATGQALADQAATDAAARKKAAKPKTVDQLKYSGYGRYFHEIHKVLKAVTRPGKYPDLHGHILLNEGFKTNFVIFVDDLDRCLPEKAVAVLELIKTIFNVESFAFVLALDEEVIERGIGHRYKEYALVNKKPQMPITGFEYLEKIVHLPFRLPALTRAQAINFVRTIEQRVESESVLRWFESQSEGPESGIHALDDYFRAVKDGEVHGKTLEDVQRLAVRRAEEPALLRLLLASFDAYVPRKLLRAVELWHQICRVARARNIAQPTGNAMTWQRIHEGRSVSIDTRVVFALAVLQLFQPELFRFMRRRVEAFPVLLRSMAGSTIAADGLNKVECSDVDLWSWASFREGEKDKAAIKRPPTEEAAVALIATLSSENAYQAQHIRLRIAERLVEHFTVQRHVFNPLRLMHWLAQELPATDVATFSDLPAYFGVLAQQSELAVAIEKPPTQTISSDGIAAGESMRATLSNAAQRFDVAEVDALFDVLVATDTAARGGIQSRFSLPAQTVFSAPAVDALVTKFLAQFSTDTGVASISGVERSFDHAVGALSAIAPWLDWADGARLMQAVMGEEWVRNEATDRTLVDRFIAQSPSPKTRDAIGDLLERFPGGDPRFNAIAPHVMRHRFHVNPDDEPIPGFVRIPAGPFQMGHSREGDNKPRSVTINAPFYIARTLTTVAQYARFVEAGGYRAGEEYWDAQGILWRNGQFTSGVETEVYKKWLARRPAPLRPLPWEWSAQLSHPSRPVTGVCWFEARAYARWLNRQITTPELTTPELMRFGAAGYEMRLPTEDQWERAARASSLTATHEHRWPWGDDLALANQLSNIEGSGINHPSGVGVFAPNAIGLYDLTGNAWQWMDNLFSNLQTDSFTCVEQSHELKTDKEESKCERLALRGGSTTDFPEDASCSFRRWLLPDNSSEGIGMRLVLSKP
jgi:formylglycine-generating enzyme required for sulfatase activity